MPKKSKGRTMLRRETQEHSQEMAVPQEQGQEAGKAAPQGETPDEFSGLRLRLAQVDVLRLASGVLALGHRR